MKTKHTQGEWTLRSGINDIRSEDNYIIAQIGSANNNDQEADANAKLIAAAPKLLEALSLIAEGVGNGADRQGLHHIAVNAIKKATH